jgi:phosphate transport system substrate-binding protein
LVAAALLATAVAQAQTVDISGSTGVVKEAVDPQLAAIKQATGIEVKTHAMVSGRGMLALLQGKSQMAAVSESLEDATANAKAAMADAGVTLPIPANLEMHEIGREKIAVYVHKDNPVATLSRAQLKDLFSGKVRNWKQVGGPDVPVKLYLSAPGSATRAIVQRQVLDGAEYPADAPEFRTALSAMVEVAKDRGGLAAAGLLLMEQDKSGKVRPVQMPPLERPIGFITVGKPAEPVQKVIDFLRKKK